MSRENRILRAHCGLNVFRARKPQYHDTFHGACSDSDLFILKIFLKADTNS